MSTLKEVKIKYNKLIKMKLELYTPALALLKHMLVSCTKKVERKKKGSNPINPTI